MLEFLKSWIINIVTISIILILFEIIIPTGKIKKIINLVSGFVLLIAVINPFLTLKNQGFDLSANTVADSFYIDKKEVENSSKVLKDTQMKQISTVYKKKLISKIQDEANKLEGVESSKAEIVINEDYTSDKYGEINTVYLELKKGKKQSESLEVKPVIAIKKVDITNQSDKNKSIKSLKVMDAESKRLTELVKQNLNKTLEIQKDNIVVTVI
ncbi:MAG TPA: stage III sporulation protein AF [Ruminiclostridium sp.]